MVQNLVVLSDVEIEAIGFLEFLRCLVRCSLWKASNNSCLPVTRRQLGLLQQRAAARERSSRINGRRLHFLLSNQGLASAVVMVACSGNNLAS